MRPRARTIGATAVAVLLAGLVTSGQIQNFRPLQQIHIFAKPPGGR